MNYRIERTNTENPNFKVLEKRLDEELYEMYGELEFNKVKDLKTIIIYDKEVPIACGSLKFVSNDLIEIKRVYVSSKYRSCGIAKIVMKELEKWAIESNRDTLILQTGIKQKAAINLYKAIDFITIENYGPYVNDTNSICMKKTILNVKIEL